MRDMYCGFDLDVSADELDTDAAGIYTAYPKVKSSKAYFIFPVTDWAHNDSDEGQDAGAESDATGLARAHVKVSTKEAADDQVMNIIRIVTEELRKDTQPR